MSPAYIRDLYKLRFPPWAKISDEARAFIGGLLTLHAGKRLTAGEALQHPWLSAESGGAVSTNYVDSPARLPRLYATPSSKKLAQGDIIACAPGAAQEAATVGKSSGGDSSSDNGDNNGENNGNGGVAGKGKGKGVKGGAKPLPLGERNVNVNQLPGTRGQRRNQYVERDYPQRFPASHANDTARRNNIHSASAAEPRRERNRRRSASG